MSINRFEQTDNPDPIDGRTTDLMSLIEPPRTADNKLTKTNAIAPLSSSFTETSPHVSPEEVKSEIADADSDIEEAKGHQSNFAAVRRAALSGKEQVAACKGSQVADKLMEMKQTTFQKMFPFERAQYHQCIPIPTRPNEFITVQLMLKSTNRTDPNVSLADLQKTEKGASLYYDRYNMVIPPKEDDGSDEEDDLQRSDTHQVAKESKTADFLYAEGRLNEQVNQVTGIRQMEFARLKKQIRGTSVVSSHVAIIAYWKLSVDKVFECYHFFIVPNPMKREVKECEGTKLNQILFKGKNTDQKEAMYFFYQDPDFDDPTKLTMKLGIINLEKDMSEIQYQIRNSSVLGPEARTPKFNCTDIYEVSKNGENSLLEHYIKTLDSQSLDEQKQMPNPNLQFSLIGTPCLIFTAWLLQDYASCDEMPEGSVNNHKSNWYPTIYFYDLQKQEVVWEIFGAEVYIGSAENKVYYLSNDIWSSMSLQQMKLAGPQSRHKIKPSFIKVALWKMKPMSDELKHRQTRHRQMAPKLYELNRFKSSLENQKTWELTDKSKVVDGFLHNDATRVTLVFRGLCSFTFCLNEAKGLDDMAVWEGHYLNNKFTSELAFLEKGMKIKGKGYESGNKVKKFGIEGSVDMQSQTSWTGWWLGKEGMPMNVTFDQFKLNRDTGEFKSEGTKYDGNFAVEGTCDFKSNQKGLITVSFEKHTPDGKTLFHKGKMNQALTVMSGSWGFSKDKLDAGIFKIQQSTLLNATIRFMNQDSEEAFQQKIVINPSTLDIVCYDKGDSNDFSLHPSDHIDNAQLIYFILQEDVQCVFKEKDVYIQCKLTSMSDNSLEGNGDGYVESSLLLYKISEDRSKREKQPNLLPCEKELVKFEMNQSLLTSRQRYHPLLWEPMTMQITKSENGQQQMLGSIIYEDAGTRELCLSFYTSAWKIHSKEQLEYPQQPLAQTWIVDYPLLSYKCMTPDNREIALVHLAYNQPQKILNLGEWEFVCFVNHTQAVALKIFKTTSGETWSNIMMLVKLENKMRLMCISVNPWFVSNHQEDTEDRWLVFLFSGVVAQPVFKQAKVDARQYSSDKIRSVQLLTKSIGTYEQFTLVIQYEHQIATASLTSGKFIVQSRSPYMCRLHMIRGFNNKVFFCESSGETDKIFQVQLHNSIQDTPLKKEIYQHSGSQIIALELDGENIQNDRSGLVTQSFFILDKNAKVHKIIHKADDLTYYISDTKEFTWESDRLLIYELAKTDWSHVHISNRTITFGGVTYSLSSKLKHKQVPPRNYFGQKKITGENKTRAQDSDENELSDDDLVDKPVPYFQWEANEQSSSEADKQDQSELHKESNSESREWRMVSVQGMQETTSMIAVCHANLQEFAFLVKPSPGSRKTDLVAFGMIPEIKEMIFLSNQNILVKFNSQKCVTFRTNGQVIHQSEEIQEILQKVDSRILGQSFMNSGKCFILCGTQSEGTFNELALLRFKQNGMGEIAGFFPDIYSTICQKIKDDYENQSDYVLPEIDDPNVVSDNSYDLITSVCQTLKFSEKHVITDDGQIVIIGAIVVPREKQEIENRFQRWRDRNGTYFPKERKVKIGIYSFNSNEQDQNKNNMDSSVSHKMILFTASSEENRSQLLKECDFTLIGPYLVQRHKSELGLWYTKLEQDDQDKLANKTVFRSAVVSKSIRLQKMMQNIGDIDHVLIYRVPKSSYQIIKSRKGPLMMTFYDNLVQIVVRNQSIILNLDDEFKPKEINFLQDIDQLIDPDFFVNSGFKHAISTCDDSNVKRMSELISNEQNTLCIAQTIFSNGSSRKEQTIEVSGILYRTFAEVDLYDLQMINESIRRGAKLEAIDIETILSTYEGHTIFSIYWEQVDVFEQIVNQVQNATFENEVNIMGAECESQYRRRMFRVLSLPTTDLTQQTQRKDEDDNFGSALAWIQSHFSKKTAKYGTVGFKTILQKSVYFSNTRYRDSLINIAMYCNEIAISSFVDNIDDIKILFASMSPQVTKLFEIGFSESLYCKRVKHAEWKSRSSGIFGTDVSTLEVFVRASSIIDETVTNCHVKENQRVSFSKELTKRQVSVRMLKTDWVFRDNETRKSAGMSDLIEALANAPNEQIFSTDLITTLMSSFWRQYQQQIRVRCFIPFLIYLLTSVIYFSKYIVKDLEEGERFAMTWECTLRFILYICILYFTWYEFRQLQKQGIINFFFSISFNLVDLTSTFLNIIILVKRNAYPDLYSLKTQQTVASVAVWLMWIKILYWMRLFDSTSFFVRLLQDTVYDSVPFTIMLVFMISAFANAWYILNLRREHFPEEDDGHIFEEYLGNDFVNSWFFSYLVGLGDFSVDGYGGQNENLIWFMFIAATYIVQILFFNMLIAIMGDTFDRVTEAKKQSALKEKLRILNDYVDAVSFQTRKGKEFVFAVKPIDFETESADDWEGKISAINLTVQESIGSHNEDVNRGLTEARKVGVETALRIDNLEGKIDQVHTSLKIQLRDQMKEIIESQTK